MEGRKKVDKYSRLDEKQIISLIRQRDEKGMDELLKHYGPLMRYIISPILPNAHDQEDCISEVVIRVWNKIDTYIPNRGSWNSWLTAVTRNTALNYKRDTCNHNATEQIPDDLPSTEPTPESKVLKQERERALNVALQKFSKEEKILFYRKYYYFQSTAQIASEMGMTERAVEGKLYRMKTKLRKMLGGEGYDKP